MASLQERLRTVLSEVLTADAESDGALTVHHDGTIASLRVVPITEDLDLVALTQVVAWDLLVNKKVRDNVAGQAHSTLLGSVTLVEKAGKSADVMLRYNFPGNGLNDEALRTLILMVLGKGAEIRRAVMT
jgi:type VI protein secretion system component VasK